MVNALSIFCVASYLAFAHGAPTSPELSDNAGEAQILNFKFQHNQPRRSDSCNSGQRACIEGQVAQCVFGRWETQPCEGADDQCYAVPGKPSVVVKCMDQTSLKTVFQAYGLDSAVANGTDTEAALPTTDVPLSTVSSTATGSASLTSLASSATATSVVKSSSPATVKPTSTNATAISNAVSATATSSATLATSSSDDSEGGVTTVTMTITVPFTSTVLPTGVRTISPEEASRIIASAEEATKTAHAFSSSSASATSVASASTSLSLPGPLLSSVASIVTSAASSTSQPPPVVSPFAPFVTVYPASYHVIRRRGGKL